MLNRIPESVRGQLDSMLRLGAAGDLSDGQLLERVDGSGGEPAEAAFAVLVERHGPMVLRVCRDTIGNPHDAEDAFQAVFLVLARKAGSVRRRESAAGWLFGVARIVSSRARRDSARRREHERRKAEQAGRAPFDAASPQSWEGLHEEIDRLPEVYRSAVVLCHLEGLSHEEAAARLRCPVRTLQSRLLRAKARLRDRLTRRGVTPGAGAFALLEAGSPSATLQAKLASSTVRLALSGPAGVVPAAVSCLAEGVLAMSASSKLIPAMVALISLGLAAGVAWAVVPWRASEPATPRPPAVVDVPKAEPKGAVAKAKEPPGPVVARGVVVDEEGRPVAGAEVVAGAFTNRESRGVSAPDGSFAVPVRSRQIDGTPLWVRSADGTRLGHFNHGHSLSPEQVRAPARVVVRPVRTVSVRVLDANDAPVEGATVDVIGGHTIFAEGTTGLDGSVDLAIPVDAMVDKVVVLKSGRGLDYAEFGKGDEAGRTLSGLVASEIPATVALTLDGARTVKIRAVDGDGQPLAGVGFGPWLIKKEGRRSELNLGDYRAFGAVTGPDGVATFDYLPETKGTLQFWPRGQEYTHRRVNVVEGETGPVTTRMTKNETIRGRVLRADGSPAPGIRVEAYGSGRGFDNGRGQALSDLDGSYEMTVSPDEAYAVSIEDENWAAPTRLDVVVLAGHPVEGVDFRLARGTIVRGKVTVGPGDRPASGQFVRLDEATGNQAPAEVLEAGDRTWREVRHQFGATTDAQGRYSIRVGPGKFTITGPPRTTTEKVTIQAEPELVRDFKMPRATKGPISGRVVQASTNRAVAGAKVEVFALNQMSIPFTVTTDAEGRFQAERDLDPLLICAKDADGSLGAIVEVGAEDPEVVIAVSPTATASGFIINEKGKPAANQQLAWGLRVYLDAKRQLSTLCFAPKVVTDAAGRFTLPSLVVGQEYEISVERGGTYFPTGMVRPEDPASIDLGPLRVGAYRPKALALADAEEMSSFRKGGAEAGDVAPPIEATTLDGKPLRLADFRGQYVLLDFWATWCGPCIGEIPTLQGVHEAFGRDKRFAILSLSVDEKVEEPRLFQEKRKLPWAQGFLGQGIHSPIPGTYGVRAIPAFVLVGPDGKIVAKGMRGDDIKKEVARALGK